MVCYARPAGRMAAIILLVFLVFSRPISHYFDAAALVVAITVAIAVAAAMAAVAFGVFLAVRRRRAAAGGCVSCQLRCQHAMTEQPRRLLLNSTVDRAPAATRSPAATRDRPRVARPGRGGRIARPTAPVRRCPSARPSARPGPRTAVRSGHAPARPSDRPALDNEFCVSRLLPHGPHQYPGQVTGFVGWHA